MKKFHKDGTLPTNNELWVFGSNESGHHGAGAARVALDEFGAKWGDYFGVTGNCFAIPTKDRKLNTLSLEYIKQYVDKFVQFTKDRKTIEFFVTRVGCGLAGYKDSEIAPMFKECGDNCSFAEEWKIYL